MQTLGHSRESRVQTAIRSACRRRFLVIAVEQSGWATAFAFGGSILLLLLGTQILDWYWLLLLVLGGVAVAAVKTSRNLAGQYRVAQILDQKLDLSDSLSTAWFLSSQPALPQASVAQLDLHRAEEIAQSVHPASAFPFKGGRTWTVTLALAAVACGLFGVRYLVSNSLSLRQPIIPLKMQSAFEQVAAVPHTERREKQFEPGAYLSDPAVSASPDSKRDGRRSDAAGPETPNSEAKPGSPTANALKSNQEGSNGNPLDSKQPQTGDSNGREGSQPGAKPQGGEKSASDKPSSETSKTQEKPSDNQQPSSSLLNKMKDALSSMMSKMQPNASQQNSAAKDRPSSDKQSASQQSSSSAKKEGQERSQSSSASQESTKEQNAEGQAQGQASQKAQSGQGRSADEQPDKQNSDAHSGVGAQDGEKGLKDAEQLQAMGKLAEIIGKRSASLTGEIVVETPSGKQQLKTAYSQRQGRHSDSGGEINRNEIPLMYQQYIREYMDEVHKQAKSDK